MVYYIHIIILLLNYCLIYNYARFTKYESRVQDHSALKWSRASPYVLNARLSNNELCSIVSIANMTSLSARDSKYFGALNNYCKRGPKNYWKLMNMTKMKSCSIGGIEFDCYEKPMEPYIELLQLKNGTMHNKNECGLTLIDRLNYFTHNWSELKPPVNIRYTYTESIRLTLSNYAMKNINFYGDSVLKQVSNAFQYCK